MKLLLHDYGGYAFSLQLAEKLANLGHSVHYLHGGAMQSVQRSHLESKQLNLHIDSAQITAPFAKYSLVKRWGQEREYGARLAKKAAQIGPDVIISSTSPLDSQNYLVHYANKSRAKFVFWWQDITGLATKKILSKKNPLLGWLVGEYYQAMERSQLRHSAAVIAITEEFRNVYKTWKLDENKFHILPNWAPIDEIPQLPKDNLWGRQNGLQDKFVFLYSGILALKHNPNIFILLAKHFSNNPQVQIVVISQGPGADWLNNHAQHNLLVLPFQPYNEFPKMLACADVLVAAVEEHAGEYSVPSKILSYLCAGRPILLSAPLQNQASLLLQEHLAGLVSAPSQIEQFLEQATNLYQDSHLRRHFGHNARQYALKSFNIKKICDKITLILNGLGN